MRHLLFALFSTFPLFLWAQTVSLLGEVRATNGQTPLAYAVIRVQGTQLGCVSNAKGQFRLELPRAFYRAEQSLVISCLGYATVEIPVKELYRGRINQINLPDQIKTLDEVMIFATDLTPRQMVEAAFHNIADNYPQHPYVLRAFYRHYCQENGVYGRLIEAAVDMYDPHGHAKHFNSPKDKIELNVRQLRRSLDFTRYSAYRHAPIALFSTLEIDYSSYEGPLSSYFRRQRLTYQIADTTAIDGKPVLVIRADGFWRKWTYNCDLYLTVGEWAIVKIDEYRSREINNNRQALKLVEHLVARYQEQEGTFFLSHILKEGRREEQYLREDGSIWQQLDHRHHIELMVNDIQIDNIHPFTGDEPTESEMNALPYDPGFWAGYTQLDATPEERRIAADLSQRISLEKQFRARDQVDQLPIIQEIRVERQVAQLITTFRGHPILMVFWDHTYRPDLTDLWRIRKLITKTPKMPLGLIFLSLDPDDQTWQAAIKRNRLYAGEHIRLGLGLNSPITTTYDVTTSPSLILFDETGQELWRGNELPKAKEIEALLAQLQK